MSLPRRSLLTAGAATGLLATTGSHASGAVRDAHGHSFSAAALARSLPGRFRSGHAEVNGTRLHYVTGGAGAPVVLLPGWPRTWWEFHKVMPALAERYRVIAVDLRGMGGSAKPESGYDKKTMARDVHELVRTLGHDRVDLVGSDIGAMVAYSFAANHPDATGRVALLDVAHPEEGMYQLSLLPLPDQAFHLWWFAFNQVRGLPEQLLIGRFRLLVDWLCDQILVNPNSVTDLDRAVYAHAYSHPDAIRAGNGWYQTFAQDIADDRGYRPVTAPLLALAAEGNYPYLRDLLPTKATDVEVVKMEDTGHYIVEEQPEAVVRRLTDFLTPSRTR